MYGTVSGCTQHRCLDTPSRAPLTLEPPVSSGCPTRFLRYIGDTRRWEEGAETIWDMHGGYFFSDLAWANTICQLVGPHTLCVASMFCSLPMNDDEIPNQWNSR